MWCFHAMFFYACSAVSWGGSYTKTHFLLFVSTETDHAPATMYLRCEPDMGLQTRPLVLQLAECSTRIRHYRLSNMKSGRVSVPGVECQLETGAYHTLTLDL